VGTGAKGYFTDEGRGIRAKDIVCGDEKYFRCNCVRKGQYVRHGEQPTPQVIERWTASAHVFAIIGMSCKRLWLLPKEGSGPRGGVTGEDFVSLLSRNLAEIRRITDGKWLLLDNCSVHNRTIDYLRSKGVKIIENFPAYSPDLNPIENYWSYLARGVGRYLRGLSATAENRLVVWDMVKMWHRMSNQAVVTSFVASLDQRIVDCIALSGDWIRK